MIYVPSTFSSRLSTVNPTVSDFNQFTTSAAKTASAPLTNGNPIYEKTLPNGDTIKIFEEKDDKGKTYHRMEILNGEKLKGEKLKGVIIYAPDGFNGFDQGGFIRINENTNSDPSSPYKSIDHDFDFGKGKAKGFGIGKSGMNEILYQYDLPKNPKSPGIFLNKQQQKLFE